MAFKSYNFIFSLSIFMKVLDISPINCRSRLLSSWMVRIIMLDYHLNYLFSTLFYLRENSKLHDFQTMLFLENCVKNNIDYVLFDISLMCVFFNIGYVKNYVKIT